MENPKIGKELEEENDDEEEEIFEPLDPGTDENYD